MSPVDARPEHEVWCPECADVLLASVFADVAERYAEHHGEARNHHPQVRVVAR